jgi:hypothetical protein
VTRHSESQKGALGQHVSQEEIRQSVLRVILSTQFK